MLDTHVVLWLWDGPAKRLSQDAARAIERADILGIPAIVPWEIAVLTERRRIRLDKPVRDWLRDALAQPRMELLPLTADISVRAARLMSADFDPSDLLIAATALEHNVPLVTRDGRLPELAGLQTIW